MTMSNSLNQSAKSNEDGIRSTMAAYNDALNGGKTAGVLPLYTEDGVFMPPYNQSAIGKDAVGKAYDAVFDQLKFDVKFTIAELVQMAPTWAYVRTNSVGTTHYHSNDQTTAEANQELFILKKGDDQTWRIARYSFSPTSAPSP
ncbi:MAG: SgcJ/EcaC family oxidoreductase [Bradyrhizobium sp.]|nr:SgcJ/EcaC family oxidoreductase [Bradyrhizobium sp.]